MVHLKEAKDMFWALVLEAGKRYSQTVEQSFHISMAALEIPTDPEASKGKQNQTVSVMIGNTKSEFLICSLNNRNATQQPLDLNFNEGEEITFFINGQGTVHLTGYQIEEDDGMDMLSDMDDEDLEDEDEEVPALVPAKKRKQGGDEAGSLKKKTKWLTPGGGDFEDSDEDSSDDEDFNPQDMLDMEAGSGEDSDFDEDDDFDDEDMDSDFDDDEDDDELEAEPVKKTPKSEKKKQKEQTPNVNGKKEQSKQSQQTPKQQSKPKGQTETPKQQQKQESPASTPAGPGGDAEQSAKKKKKKKKKNKNKDGENESSQDEAKTPQPQKQEQKQQTPGGKTPQPKTPQGKPEPGKTPKKMVMPGGIIAEDITTGDGAMVKKGKMAHVYYVGKLQKDGRQFDSCTKGKPFRFKLGLGEVIQGWDKGVEGMKVGGKRRLTVPPSQGYGNQRSGPIPPNSTLVFEVELKNVS